MVNRVTVTKNKTPWIMVFPNRMSNSQNKTLGLVTHCLLHHLLNYVGTLYQFQVEIFFYLYQYFLTCLNMSDIIVIAVNVFDPTQAGNKYFPVIPTNRRESGRQIK